MFQRFFHVMSRIERLDFVAHSGPDSQMNWNHRATGSVQVHIDGDDIHFIDRFVLDNGLHCEDRKCWRFTDEGIVFRHWRQRQYQDILLLTVQPKTFTAEARPSPSASSIQTDPSASSIRTETSAPGTGHTRLIACAPYHCPPDFYSGTLTLQDDGLLLSLSITGRRKNEHILYRYHPATMAG